MEEYKLASKYFNKKKNSSNNINKWIYSLINRTLLSALLLLISLCLIKNNTDIKTFISENVYNKNISFTNFNKIFKKIYPEIVNTIEKDKQVFNESFIYKNKESYKDGVKLTVSNNYLMPALESGIVVYIGDKDNYGHTIIIQQVNGIDLWYVGVNNTNLKLYDYIEKGSLLGEANSNEIYLYYQKDGKFIDYKEYLG